MLDSPFVARAHAHSSQDTVTKPGCHIDVFSMFMDSIGYRMFEVVTGREIPFSALKNSHANNFVWMSPEAPGKTW